ncbi:Protein argonaute-1 [Trichinella spiralis]|uniref:Protein argonaute-1 n=1 Tax=Trichinella spiralis TaxID=6334 RepID=A0A0V1BVB5_TRISP|nr:Protein argonaute-1 [Trichinella spiralis]
MLALFQPGRRRDETIGMSIYSLYPQWDVAEKDVVCQKVVSQRVVRQELVSQRVVRQELVSQRVVRQELVSKGVVPQELVSQQVVRQELVSQQVVRQELVSKGVVREELVSQGVVPQELVSQRVVRQELVSQRVVRQELVSKGVVPQELQRGGAPRTGEPRSDAPATGEQRRMQHQSPRQYAPAQGMQQTEASFGQMSLKEKMYEAGVEEFDLSKLSGRCVINYAQRNSFGSMGTAIDLHTNYFSIKIPKDLTFHHYSVEILLTVNRRKGTVDVCTYRLSSVLYENLQDAKIWNFNYMFYDQRTNLFSLNNLQISESVEYTITTPQGKAKITIKPCNPLLIHIQDVIYALVHIGSDSERSALQALDIATSMKLFDTEVMSFGNKFFKPVANKLSIGGGVELYDGLFKSLRPMLGAACGKCYLAFNIESVKAAFYTSQPLLQSLQEELRLSHIPNKPLHEQQIAQLNKKYSVRTTHLNRSFKIQGFSDKIPRTHVFTDDNGVNTTVFDYFRNKYNIILRYPNLQMVKKGHTFIPPELCNVEPNQRVPMMKLDDENHRMIVQTCAVPPVQRYREILAKSNAVGGDCHDLFAAAMGLTKSSDMVCIKGRVLPEPSVQYQSDAKNSGRVQVRNGQWDMKQNKVFVAAEISHWALCNMCPTIQQPQLVQFVHLLVQKAASMGINMNPRPVSYDCFHPREALERMKTYFDFLIRQRDATYAICVIPEKSEVLRRSIKYYGEVVNGVVTQILLRNTVMKGFLGRKSETLYMQIMLKVNAKNGGVNNEISMAHPIANMWFRGDLLFMGFDVNHPPALSRREKESGEVPLEPSVVGAVCNCGRTQFDYRIRYRLQDSRKEEIEREKIVGVVMEFLKEYQNNNKNTLPKSVVVYRDGVSESQFEMVLESEKASLQEAFGRFRRGYSPKLTIVIVQKRHHTRFFRTDMNPSDKNMYQNIPAGTVVDTGPVSCRLFDFYLCSHLGIQGTSRPTLYTVLYDENEFNANAMQGITYLLCQTYQRCNKSVSIPAPVYHAHHAATRGKELYCAYRNKMMEEGGGSELTADFVRLEEAINSKPVIQQKMTWALLQPRTKARKVERRWMTMAMVLCPSRRPSGQGRRCSGRRRRSRPSPVRLASVHCPEGEASVVEAGCRNFPQSSLRAVQSPSCRRETSTLRIPVYSSDLRVHLNKKEMFIYTKQVYMYMV